jgi:hypothetical protein
MKQDESKVVPNVEILATIILAIETHNSLAIQYTKDVDYNEVRTVYPHNLYRNSDNTKVFIDGFQIDGASKSGKINSFKQFNCEFIKSCCVLDDKFHIQKGYNSQSNRYNNSIIGIVD